MHPILLRIYLRNGNMNKMLLPKVEKLRLGNDRVLSSLGHGTDHPLVNLDFGEVAGKVNN